MYAREWTFHAKSTDNPSLGAVCPGCGRVSERASAVEGLFGYCSEAADEFSLIFPHCSRARARPLWSSSPIYVCIERT